MKHILKTILYICLNAVSACLPKERAAILLYHDVGGSDLYLTVPSKKFEAQMKYLKEGGYSIMSLSTLVALLREGQSPQPKTVVLTFDDAYTSHLSVVLPILEKYGFQGTFFVATGSMGSTLNNSENKPQTILNADALQKLEASPCADIQPHSLSHREFTTLGREEVRKEIEESRALLEVLLNKKCTFFAYPRGAQDAVSRNVVREAGFVAAVSVMEGMAGLSSDLYVLPRNTIHGHVSHAEFKGKLTHSSGIMSRLRAFV